MITGIVYYYIPRLRLKNEVKRKNKEGGGVSILLFENIGMNQKIRIFPYDVRLYRCELNSIIADSYNNIYKMEAL